MNHLDALLKVIVDGQAWLYANQMMQLEVTKSVTLFEAYEKEWKDQTAQLVEELCKPEDQ